jgi:hypothetical protein
MEPFDAQAVDYKLRAALVRPEREPLGPFVEMDEALIDRLLYVCDSRFSMRQVNPCPRMLTAGAKRSFA